MRWFPDEAGYSAEKVYTDINLPVLMSNDDKNITHWRLFDFGVKIMMTVVVCSIFVFRRRTSGGGNGCSGIMGQESHAIEGHMEERQANEPSLVSTF